LDRGRSRLLQSRSIRRTARKRTRRDDGRRLNWVLAAINNAHRAVVRASSENALYHAVCEALTSATPFTLATISVADEDPARAIRVVAAAGKAIGYLDGLTVTWDDGPLGNGPGGRAWRTGEIQFNDDLLADARFNPWRERALAHGLRSSFVLPVSLPGGAVAVLLSVYSERRAAVDAQQLEHFRLLGDDLGVCIEVLRGRAALQAALERSERQDRELALLQRTIENNVAGVVVTDADNRIAAVNPAFETLFGYRQQDLIGRDPALLASGRHGTEYFRAMWDELRAHGHWAGDIVNRGRDGREIVCWLSIAAVENAEGQVAHYIGSFRDITEQIQSMEALRREQCFADAIMESMPGIVYFYDRSGRFRRWNRNFLDVTGYSPEEVVRMQPLDFCAAEHRAALWEWSESVFTRGEDALEAAFLTKAGQTIPYLLTGRRLHYAGEDFLIGVGIDISKRKAAERTLDAHVEQLQSLSRQVLEIQETERNALGRELHDTVAQDIGAVCLNLTILRDLLGGPPAAAVAQRLEDSQKLLEDAAERLRDVMAELRPPGLDEFGLMMALGEHAERVARRAGFAITLRGEDPQPRFAAPVAIALFRITQEALNNIVKHAHASHVTISLSAAPDRVELEIRDDGIGFEPGASPARAHGGMGMLTMAERAESIGARCTVESTPGGGTRVVITAPLPGRDGPD
jgi:PAS domain S-box-containing protein